jgi:hypothetical protein
MEPMACYTCSNPDNDYEEVKKKEKKRKAIPLTGLGGL